MPIIVDGVGSPGTTLVLNRLWLNDVANPADLVSLAVSDFAPTRTVGGQVRTLSNGRLRAVRQAWSLKSMTAQMRRLTRAQLDWLDEHNGRPVTVRDPDGGKFVGVYFGHGYTNPVEGGAEISLTLNEVTVSEAV